MSSPPPVVEGHTFASRNPFKDINPSRSCHRGKLTDAQKVSAEAKRAINKENADALRAELDNFFELQDAEITRLAKQFNKSEVKIKQLLSNETTYKYTHAPTLRNALVYAKGVEMNENREQGDRLKLSEIQKLVDDDTAMQDLSEEKQKEYINDLQLHRTTKMTGARSSNNAAAADCRTSITNVTTELRNLSERTGMCALAFFTRTHIHDNTMPTWVDSDDAVAFLTEVLEIDPMDFLGKFEQWACARDKAYAVRENLQTMRCDCTRIISNGLRLILNLKNVGMCYRKYDQNIVTRHKVELVGWPTSINFANPSEIGNVDDIRKLRQALMVGECKWIVQSRGQQAAYAEKVARKAAAGEQVPKKRKQRSDKGKQRGSKGGKNTSGQSGKRAKKHTGDEETEEIEDFSEEGDNGENSRQPPKKKRKVVEAAKKPFQKKLPPAPKSKPFIAETDDDDDDE